MARTALSVQKAVPTGLNPVYTAANVDGHSVVNNGQTVVHVKNGGGSSINVTIPTPGKVAGIDIADVVVAVPNGGERIIGPFDPRAFAQVDGSVNIDFSAVTSVTVAALST